MDFRKHAVKQQMGRKQKFINIYYAHPFPTQKFSKRHYVITKYEY
jgi:hypothetical protein